jgi:hypothetical protein
VKLHFLTIGARFGGGETDEAKTADLAGILPNAILFVDIYTMLCGAVLVDSGAVVTHLLSKRICTTHIQLMIPLHIICAIVAVQCETRIRRVRNRDLRRGSRLLLATRVTLILARVFHGLMLVCRPKVRSAVYDVLEDREEVTVVIY